MVMTTINAHANSMARWLEVVLKGIRNGNIPDQTLVSKGGGPQVPLGDAIEKVLKRYANFVTTRSKQTGDDSDCN